MPSVQSHLGWYCSFFPNINNTYESYLWPPQTVKISAGLCIYWFPPKSKLPLSSVTLSRTCNWACPFKFQLTILWTNQTWLNTELSALPVIPWKGHLVMPALSQGLWKGRSVAPRPCPSGCLRVCRAVLFLHTEGPFSVSSFLGNSGALSRATSLVNISLATVVLSQQRRLSARDTLAPAASAQGLLCERGLSQPVPPRAPHHKAQTRVLPIPLGLSHPSGPFPSHPSGPFPSHPSGPFSSDRNVRTQLDAFSGAVSNFGLTCSP